MLIAWLGPWVGGTLAFGLLVLASWCVGEGGEILGEKYDASIVGGLVIAWLNTGVYLLFSLVTMAAPEAIFFITALESDNPRFAVGAMSGSTIVVSTVAMGACYYFGTTARKSRSFVIQPAVKKQCFILLLSVSVPFVIASVGFSALLSIVGVVLYLFFIAWELLKNNWFTDETLKDHDIEEGPESEESSSGEEHSTYKGVAYLLFGGLLIGFFSEPFITSIVEIASQAKVNPILLAFFLAPVASEMPEILESISLSRKGKIQNINIAIANLMGGTITKTTLLSGIFCYYGIRKEYTWESPNYGMSLSLMAICAGVSAMTGAAVAIQQTWHSYLLSITFILASLVQYFYNSTYTDAASDLV